MSLKPAASVRQGGGAALCRGRLSGTVSGSPDRRCGSGMPGNKEISHQRGWKRVEQLPSPLAFFCVRATVRLAIVMCETPYAGAHYLPVRHNHRPACCRSKQTDALEMKNSYLNIYFLIICWMLSVGACLALQTIRM